MQYKGKKKRGTLYSYNDHVLFPTCFDFWDVSPTSIKKLNGTEANPRKSQADLMFFLANESGTSANAGTSFLIWLTLHHRGWVNPSFRQPTEHVLVLMRGEKARCGHQVLLNLPAATADLCTSSSFTRATLTRISPSML